MLDMHNNANGWLCVDDEFAQLNFYFDEHI